MIGFHVLVVYSGITDVGVRQSDDLTGVGRIGQDFLVTGHGGVENHLAAGFPGSADGNSVEQASVCECKDGRCTQGLYPHRVRLGERERKREFRSQKSERGPVLPHPAFCNHLQAVRRPQAGFSSGYAWCS